MTFSVQPSDLSGVLVLEPKVFNDKRGFFLESFNQRDFFAAVGMNPAFVQDNHSHSKKNVLRGLHYQVRQPQGKLVRVVSGEVFDVSVNLQRGHPEFGHWAGIVLSAQNKRQRWIPPGFAHGFLVLSDEADFLYKTTAYYSPEHERSIAWNDPSLNIKWPISGSPILTQKDASAPKLSDAEVFEELTS
jgi:dTDP-4-dehydrorhamnose 3,5-epimerase